MKALRAGLVVVGLGLVGCSGTFRNRIVLPLSGNADPMGAEECDRLCRSGHQEADYEYLRCLASCPGATVAHNTTCSAPDVPASSICRVTDETLDASSKPEKSSGGGSSVAGAILGGLVTAAAVSAIGGGSSKSRSSSSSQSSETTGNPMSPAKQNLPGPAATPASTHKPATPSKDSSRTPATPSKKD